MRIGAGSLSISLRKGKVLLAAIALRLRERVTLIICSRTILVRQAVVGASVLGFALHE